MKKLEKDDLGFLITRELLAIMDDATASAADRIAVWEHVRGIKTMTGFAGTMAEGIKAGVNKMNNDRYNRIERKREYQRNFSKKEQSSSIVDDETRLETMNDDETHNVGKVSSVKVSKVESPKAPVGGSGVGLAKYSRKDKCTTGRGAVSVGNITVDVEMIGFPNSADLEKVSRALCSVFNMRKPTGEFVYDPIDVEQRIAAWLKYWKDIPADKVPARLQDWIRSIGFMAAVPQKKNSAPEKEQSAFEMSIA